MDQLSLMANEAEAYAYGIRNATAEQVAVKAHACKQCEAETGEGDLRKTPKQPALCQGSFASPEAVAHIMTQKFVMCSPLYRLEQGSSGRG